MIHVFNYLLILFDDIQLATVVCDKISSLMLHETSACPQYKQMYVLFIKMAYLFLNYQLNRTTSLVSVVLCVYPNTTMHSQQLSHVLVGKGETLHHFNSCFR